MYERKHVKSKTGSLADLPTTSVLVGLVRECYFEKVPSSKDALAAAGDTPKQTPILTPTPPQSPPQMTQTPTQMPPQTSSA